MVGRGLGVFPTTFAACLHPLVRQVTLVNPLLSYYELTQASYFTWPPSVLVPGILRELDLPDCYRYLAAAKQLMLIKPWNPRMRSWSRQALRRQIAGAGIPFRRIRV